MMKDPLEYSSTALAPVEFPESECATRIAMEAIRASGTQEPLFVVHDTDAEMTYARSLVPHIDPDIPAYAVYTASLEAEEPRTIEYLAARYVRRIRAEQPTGPYRLLGCSSGGPLAYEIATQLLGQDQQVAFLGLIDSLCPTVAGSVSSFQHYVVQPLPIVLNLFSTDRSLCTGCVTDPLMGWGSVMQRERLKVTCVQSLLPALSGAPFAAMGRALSQAVSESATECSDVFVETAAYQPLVSIQTGRRFHPPLFCIPGAGNSVTTFTAWADALPDAWPMYGLQPRGIDGALVPHSTVEAAATHYLRAIEEASPYGPVHLLGHSFGGWIAFELAQQLRSRGRKVASVTVLDADSPDSQDMVSHSHTATEVMLKLVDVIQMTTEKPLGLHAGELTGLDHYGRMKLLHRQLVLAGVLPQRSGPDVLLGPVRTFAAALRTAYHPVGAYPDSVRLVTVRDTSLDAESDHDRRQKLVREWRRWAPRVTSWHGPGNHMTLLESPHVAAVVDWWRDGLQTR